ncbi:general substrate transporter [Ascobolus immersus RN42]|uniref:General substrate transporter n=1 Tax=Ascobolus immersus RN42 TaxID=1160509 RepID=A0A3N4HQZ0_ASCIM|nr:general substrate transporter [Ascobolus immersus RN42]
MPAGSFLGSLISSPIANKWSRKYAIQLAGIIWIIGALIQCFAQNVGMLVAGRVIAGICVGMTSALVPVYQSEIAPKEIRGRIVSLQQWAITWGILIQYFIQYGCSFVDGGITNPNQSTKAFRIPWGIQAVPGAILVIGLIWFPKSPRWLASKDRWEECLSVLADIHGHGDPNHPRVLAEYTEIKEAIRFEREDQATSITQILKPRILKRVGLGMMIQMWSQLCGMNVMMYYIVYVMQGAGIDDPLLSAAIQYVINVVMTIPAIIWVDKWGRRPTLLLGSFGMMTWLFISGSLQGVYGEPNPVKDGAVTWVLIGKKNEAKAIIACSYLFVASFAISWGPVSWTYPAEIFPLRVRALAVSIATCTNWAWNCALAFAVPPLLRSINWKMYLIFGAFNGCALINMFLMAHETKGRTLEEMDSVFDSGLPPWKTGGIESKLDTLAKQIEQGEIKVKLDESEKGNSTEHIDHMGKQ